jgi:uncharacterized protein
VFTGLLQRSTVTAVLPRSRFAAVTSSAPSKGAEVDRDGAHVLWIYDAEGNALMGREGRNLLRWLNHSHEPNAELDGFDLYACRAIAVDDEITIDYTSAC